MAPTMIEIVMRFTGVSLIAVPGILSRFRRVCRPGGLLEWLAAFEGKGGHCDPSSCRSCFIVLCFAVLQQPNSPREFVRQVTLCRVSSCALDGTDGSTAFESANRILARLLRLKVVTYLLFRGRCPTFITRLTLESRQRLAQKRAAPLLHECIEPAE